MKREASPALFENQKYCSDFEKKGHDCVHQLIKFSIQNVVLKVHRRKKLENVILEGLFFLCFWRNVYRSALVPHPPALKNIWLRTSTQALFSWKTIHLKCFYSFLNTSILETVRWFYALYCIRHILNNYGIFNTVFFRCIGWILAYSIIFSVIKAYSHILRHY